MGCSVREQLLQLGAALLLGLALGTALDLLRALRLRLRSRALRCLAEVLWCLAAGFGLFLFGMTCGRGAVRLFMLAAAMLAAALWQTACSRRGTALWCGILDILSRILRLCLEPLRFCRKIARKFLKVVKKGFQYAAKWARIK